MQSRILIRTKTDELFFFSLFEYMLGFETFKQFWISESLLASRRYQVIFTSTENMENPLNYKIILLLLLPLSIFISFTSHFHCYPFILSVWQQGRIFPGKLRTSSWDINALWHGHPLFTWSPWTSRFETLPRFETSLFEKTLQLEYWAKNSM